MIKGLLASNGARLVAACVCPVAGTVAVTVGVPQVRHAVHRATAPRAYALPKTRVRPPAAVPIEAAPIATAAIGAPCVPAFETASLNADFDNGVTELGAIPRPRVDGPILPDAGVPLLPGVPEPRSWVQMLIGFGLIGGATRYALKYNRVELPATSND